MTSLDRVSVRRACLAMEKHARQIIRKNLNELAVDWSRSMEEAYKYTAVQLEAMMEQYQARKLFWSYEIFVQPQKDGTKPTWKLDFVFREGHKPISIVIKVERI